MLCYRSIALCWTGICVISISDLSLFYIKTQYTAQLRSLWQKETSLTKRRGRKNRNWISFKGRFRSTRFWAGSRRKHSARIIKPNSIKGLSGLFTLALRRSYQRWDNLITYTFRSRHYTKSHLSNLRAQLARQAKLGKIKKAGAINRATPLLLAPGAKRSLSPRLRRTQKQIKLSCSQRQQMFLFWNERRLCVRKWNLERSST